MTRTKLFQIRRQQMIPDPTFDLDGDSKVGGKDLVISRIFDQDKDGRLNTTERANALRALKEGFAENYVWGIEQAGPHRPFRILQKRGQIVDAEDFSNVLQTYPEHPDHQNKPKFASKTELEEFRKQEKVKNIEKRTKEWEEKNPHQVLATYIPSEWLVKNPKFRCKSEMIITKRREERTSIGLLPENNENKVVDKDPGLSFVQQPSHKCYSELYQHRHQQNLQELHAKKNYNHKDGIKRLEEREECYIKLIRPGEEGLTYNQIQKQRTKEILEHNMKTFGNVAIGIHGKELPKFSEDQNTKKWWEKCSGFNNNPKEVSAKMQLQNQKFWAKKDEMLLNDIRQAPAESTQDPFKKEHYDKKKVTEIVQKPNQIIHFDYEPYDPHSQPAKQKPNHNYKWSTLVTKFQGKAMPDFIQRPETVKKEKAPSSKQDEDSAVLKRMGSKIQSFTKDSKTQIGDKARKGVSTAPLKSVRTKAFA